MLQVSRQGTLLVLQKAESRPSWVQLPTETTTEGSSEMEIEQLFYLKWKKDEEIKENEFTIKIF